MTEKTIIISGRVIRGAGYGKILGFPTANLDRRQYSRKGLNIRFGVWAGSAKTQNSKLKTQNYRAAIVIGPRDRCGFPKIEAHLINFRGNLYGKKLTISLNKYLRPFRKFKTEADLKKQIKKDISLITN